MLHVVWRWVSRKWTLPAQFAVLFLAGTVVVGLVGVWSFNACSIRPVFSEGTGVNTGGEPGNQKRDSQYSFDDVDRLDAAISKLTASVEQIAAQQERDHRERHHSEPEPEISLCKFKIADLALIYLTYCLAIIAYHTMRSAEINAQHVERAFVFIGGGLNIEVKVDQGGIITGIMAVKNSGKSFGVLTEFYFGWRNTAPTNTIPEYPKTGVYFWDEIDLISNPGEGMILVKDGVNIAATPYMIGFIKYRDIYGINRISRCAIFFDAAEQRIAPVGPAEWNEWT